MMKDVRNENSTGMRKLTGVVIKQIFYWIKMQSFILTWGETVKRNNKKLNV